MSEVAHLCHGKEVGPAELRTRGNCLKIPVGRPAGRAPPRIDYGAVQLSSNFAVDAERVVARLHDQAVHHQQLRLCRRAQPAHVAFADNVDGVDRSLDLRQPVLALGSQWRRPRATLCDAKQLALVPVEQETPRVDVVAFLYIAPQHAPAARGRLVESTIHAVARHSQDSRSALASFLENSALGEFERGWCRITRRSL